MFLGIIVSLFRSRNHWNGPVINIKKKFVQIIRNAIVVLFLTNFSTFVVFVAANSDIIRETYGEATTQLFDCIFNIITVALVE